MTEDIAQTLRDAVASVKVLPSRASGFIPHWLQKTSSRSATASRRWVALCLRVLGRHSLGCLAHLRLERGLRQNRFGSDQLALRLDGSMCLLSRTPLLKR